MQFSWVMFVGGSVVMHEEPLHKGDDPLSDMVSSSKQNDLKIHMRGQI